MDFMSGMFGMGGGILSNLFNLFSQQSMMGWNRENMEEMMQFQERMSSTAYQRSVKDMEAAGINPILAASRGGASAPSGGAVQMGAQQFSDVVTPAMSTAIQKARNDAEMNKMDMQNESMNQQNRLTAVQEDNARETGNQIRAETARVVADTQNKLLSARAMAPEAVRGDIDKAVLATSAVAATRAASTVAEEGSRGVGAVKDAISPFIPKRTYNYYGATP